MTPSIPKPPERCRPSRYTLTLATLLLAIALFGCQRKKESEPLPSASAPSSSAQSSASAALSSVPVAIPVEPKVVQQAVNPKSELPYGGPTATVRGTVRMVGDAATPLDLSKVPAKCVYARDIYKDLFREGMLRAAADVLVTVTGYEGYVPAASKARRVEARGCAFNTRTIGLTLGQLLEVSAKDGLGYAPYLVGASSPAQLVPVPGSAPTPLYAKKPGRYVLSDQAHPFMSAEVFVLKYATFDVTGLSGKFKIGRIPPGKVTVTAFSPAIMATADKELTLKAGDNIELDLDIPFDRARYERLAKEQEKKQEHGKRPAAQAREPSGKPN